MTNDNQSRFWCVVPAAGHGIRFGGSVPKQYQPLAGKPLITHTLERLAAHPKIAGVLVALADDDNHWGEVFPALARAGADAAATLFGKPLVCVNGGASRADSTLAGLLALPKSVPDNAFVLVHDAARPCVSGDDISRLIADTSGTDGGLLATPVRDTLKRGDASGHCIATEPRTSRWRAQTPQMFRRGPLVKALIGARGDGLDVSDEAMAMEHAGFAPLLVEGSAANIKVTTAADLAIAEFLINRSA